MPKPKPKAKAKAKAKAKPKARPHTTARIVAYGIPLAATLAMVATWFRPGRSYAYGDVAPFERAALAAEIGDLWNHQISGAGAPGAQVVQVFDVLLVKATATVGLGVWVAQYLWYAAICALAALGATALARVWFRHPAAGAAAGLLAVANVYTLLMVPNPLPLLATGELALLAALLLRTHRGDRIPAPVFAIATLPAAYLAMNPPLLATVAGAVLVLALVLRRDAGRMLLIAAPIALLLHAWWLVPQVLSAHGGGGAEFTADTEVRTWEWTHVRSSIPNVLSLNSFWAWERSGEPYTDYTPYAAALDTPPWAGLRWALPLLALVGALRPPGTRTVRRAMRALAATAVVLVFVCKGVHPPFRTANLWLYDHVPGMWLLREPMAKLGVPLVLCYTTLAAASVQRAAALRKFVRTALATATAAALVYPWPLWTGEVSAATRTGGGTGRVAVPHDWRVVADKVNASDTAPGKVLQLPLQPFYMVTTTWGFTGADLVPRQLVERPVLQRMPGGYFDAPLPLRAALADAEAALVNRDGAAAALKLRELGVSQVVLRRDLVSVPGYPTADPDAIARGLAAVPGMHPQTTTTVAALYRLDPGAPGTRPLAKDRVTISTGAGATTRLTIAEAYAPGWRLAGLPSGWRATHTRAADGWANAWDIEAPAPHSTARVTTEYAPQRQADLAAIASAVSLVAVILFIVHAARAARGGSAALRVPLPVSHVTRRGTVAASNNRRTVPAPLRDGTREAEEDDRPGAEGRARPHAR